MERYLRHFMLKEIGKEGQEKLRKGKIGIVGLGGLGSALAIHMVRAGIGELRLIDEDIVDESNLQRQILYDEKDIGKGKISVAKEKLKRMNSQVEIKVYNEKLNRENISEFANVDIILDGSDNMVTRFLINDFCIKNKKPWIYCGVEETYGIVMPILPEKTACLRCLIEKPVEKKHEGILSTLPTIMASIEATMAIRYIVEGNVDEYLSIYDVWKNKFEKIKVKRKDDCICCQKRIFEYLEY